MNRYSVYVLDTKTDVETIHYVDAPNSWSAWITVWCCGCSGKRDGCAVCKDGSTYMDDHAWYRVMVSLQHEYIKLKGEGNKVISRMYRDGGITIIDLFDDEYMEVFFYHNV